MATQTRSKSRQFQQQDMQTTRKGTNHIVKLSKGETTDAETTPLPSFVTKPCSIKKPSIITDVPDDVCQSVGLESKVSEIKSRRINMPPILPPVEVALEVSHSATKSISMQSSMKCLSSSTKMSGVVALRKRLDAMKKPSSSTHTPRTTPSYVLPDHKTSEAITPEVGENKRIEKSRVVDLIAEVQRDIEMKLPNKYQNLLDKFYCMDKIVSILDGRGSRCESLDIFRSVQKNIKMDFTQKHLAQIIAVYEKSYVLSLVEQRNVAGQPVGQYDLILRPNLIDDLANFLKETSLKDGQENAEKLEGWRITCRKYIMHHLLMKWVKQYHSRFLQKIGEEVTKGLSRYHPAFLVKINEECDDIKPATLPEPPRKESNHKDVNNFLSVVKERDTNTEFEKAVDKFASVETTPISYATLQSIKSSSSIACTKSSKVSSILERIRMKEANKIAAQASRDPNLERRCFNLELLHTRLLRPLLAHYTMKNCKSVNLQLVIEKVEYLTKRTKGEIMDCIELLCSVAPGISRIVDVASTKYLQIEQGAHDELRQFVKQAYDNTGKPVFSTTRSR